MVVMNMKPPHVCQWPPITSFSRISKRLYIFHISELINIFEAISDTALLLWTFKSLLFLLLIFSQKCVSWSTKNFREGGEHYGEFILLHVSKYRNYKYPIIRSKSPSAIKASLCLLNIGSYMRMERKQDKTSFVSKCKLRSDGQRVNKIGR